MLVVLAAGALALVLAAGAVVPALGAPPARVVSQGTTTRHAVALTFDDAWDPVAARTVFAILQAHDVRATFFPVALGVARDPSLWRAVADAGDEIGNHTTSHPDLTTEPSDEVIAEIVGARRTIEAATGRRMAPLLRPPYGRLDDRLVRLAPALGFPTVVLWSVASSDWAETDGSLVASRSLVGDDGAIVLLHVGPAATIEALPAIIAGYRARGFDLVTVSELLGEG
jgi:peptidoglycan-N-acetylglucosamine deacetylase